MMRGRTIMLMMMTRSAMMMVMIWDIYKMRKQSNGEEVIFESIRNYYECEKERRRGKRGQWSDQSATMIHSVKEKENRGKQRGTEGGRGGQRGQRGTEYEGKKAHWGKKRTIESPILLLSILRVPSQRIWQWNPINSVGNSKYSMEIISIIFTVFRSVYFWLDFDDTNQIWRGYK